jgi:hypothetical protein
MRESTSSCRYTAALNYRSRSFHVRRAKPRPLTSLSRIQKIRQQSQTNGKSEKPFFETPSMNFLNRRLIGFFSIFRKAGELLQRSICEGNESRGRNPKQGARKAGPRLRASSHCSTFAATVLNGKNNGSGRASLRSEQYQIPSSPPKYRFKMSVMDGVPIKTGPVPQCKTLPPIIRVQFRTTICIGNEVRLESRAASLDTGLSSKLNHFCMAQTTHQYSRHSLTCRSSPYACSRPDEIWRDDSDSGKRTDWLFGLIF